MLVLLTLACSGKITLEEIETAEDIRTACEEYEAEDVTLSVTFEELDDGCPFGEGDNNDAANGYFSARIEQVASLDLPEGGVICDLAFDFTGLDPSFEQEMEYDDNFLMTFNDVVLATSYAPLIDEFEEEDGLPYYDWSRMEGEELSFDSDIPTWCLGEETGDSECSIPPPETDATMAVSFGGDLVDKLALVAVEANAFDFGFVAMGDNDDTDCSHSEFTFAVEAPVVTPN
jgi:hypothetical protein